ncbi:MAG: hypothetical protein QXM08_00925 [Thermofilaceae archaeon]
MNALKVLLIPVDARNLDESEEVGQPSWLEELESSVELTSERIARVLVEDGDVVLGATDLAFIVYNRARNEYFARSTLHSLITSEHSQSIPLIARLHIALRRAKPEDRVFAAVAMVSEETPGRLFYAPREIRGLEDLVNEIAAQGRSLGAVELVECNRVDAEEEVQRELLARFRTICIALELLDLRCERVGFNEEAGVCVSAGKVGFTVKGHLIARLH